jgi:nucleoside-diphosphate-sugar epimerase
VTDVSVGYREFYRGRRVLVTGGLGFIGSSLAHHLVDLGADVRLVDGMIPDYGGNLFNIADIEGRVRVNISDVRNDTAMGVLVRDREVIKHNRQGFIGWFIRLAIEGTEIQVFGDGAQMRDFVFVDDAADAFLRAGASAACDGEVFNVGGLPHDVEVA